MEEVLSDAEVREQIVWCCRDMTGAGELAGKFGITYPAWAFHLHDKRLFRKVRVRRTANGVFLITIRETFRFRGELFVVTDRIDPDKNQVFKVKFVVNWRRRVTPLTGKHVVIEAHMRIPAHQVVTTVREQATLAQLHRKLVGWKEQYDRLLEVDLYELTESEL